METSAKSLLTEFLSVPNKLWQITHLVLRHFEAFELPVGVGLATLGDRGEVAKIRIRSRGVGQRIARKGTIA